jgi:hypothetical protein
VSELASIFAFEPSPSSKKNLREFIAHCRALQPFGPGLDFDSLRWDVSETVRLRGSTVRQAIVFSALGAKSNGRGPYLREPFCTEAKAWILFRQATSPTLGFGQRLNALRALESALAESSRQPSLAGLTGGICNRAATLLERGYSAHGAYAAGLEIELIVVEAGRFGLLDSPFRWASHLRRPQLERFGSAYQKRRDALLPSAAALEALAHAFHHATEPRDRLSLAAAVIQLFTNSRICEVLTLPSHCEVIEPPAGLKAARALRWWPAKGKPPMIKPIIGGAADVIERALEMARGVTDPARTVARWYEKDRTRVFLPPSLAHLRRQEFIGLREVEALTGLEGGNSFVRGLPSWTRERKKYVRFADVEAKILKKLPHDFPKFDRTSRVKYSEALFVVPLGFFRNVLDRACGSMTCMVERVGQTHIRGALGSRDRYGRCRASVFARMGLTEADGRPIQLNTHPLRRYMSDLADRSGLTEAEQALWAGRAPRQNVHYQFMSDRERKERIDELLSDPMRWKGPLPELASRSALSRAEFAALAIPAVHLTEVGFCIHDFGMLPCPRYVNCLSCTEHLCVKGDSQRAEVARRMLAENRALLEAAKRELDDGACGADRWVQHAEKVVARLIELDRLLHDDSIPDGSIIQLAASPQPSSMIEAALRCGALQPPDAGVAKSPRSLNTELEPS